MFQVEDFVPSLFWICAIGGSSLFILRSLFLFLGADHSDGDSGFNILSLYTFAGFFMMFGWVGLGCYVQFDFSITYSILIALASGLLILFLLRGIFSSMKKMISYGDQFSLEQTLGKTGIAYSTFSEDKVGLVHVSVGEILRELSAISKDGRKIESFSKIEVIEIKKNDLIVVRKLR